MTRRTHIEQMNGSSRGPLVDSIRPYPDQLRFSLNRMNGSSFWAYSLWRAPADADLLDDIPLSEKYIQCAGSAEALTIEVRVVDEDGVARQYTVGKPVDEPTEAPTGPPTEVIRWDEGRYSTKVHPNEVFTADEAAEVFYGYFLKDSVPETYSLRELDLSR